jgi:hypothetical protein
MPYVLNLSEAAKSSDDVLTVLAQQLPRFELKIAQAAPVFQLEGQRLEHVARTLPHHQAEYDQLLREAKALYAWLEVWQGKLEAKHLKNYHRGSRAMTAKELGTFIAGEPDMVEHSEIMIDVALVRDKLDAIVEAIRQLGWMLSHITKLRVAELQDVLL